ncbi:membrane-binding protein [Leptospira perolatii]|uniref:Membrane-binding protein n=1 Tax=Leptospira perolatii TaxID=2023191 RepID=A0A2M9ZN64_9LEPT|nr:membrane-binding protein [Leptospira perolatii]PJZ68295.1 membrane-binding protein [Leptospira perolatii]PJZ73419.1 membrane-binding protein [Leptospira perolatii]
MRQKFIDQTIQHYRNAKNKFLLLREQYQNLTLGRQTFIVFLIFLGMIFISFSVYFIFKERPKCTYGNCEIGFGALSFPDGTLYSGGFYKGKFHDFGTIRKPDGHYYEGGWKLGKKHGKGKYIYPDGSSYEGDFLEDQKEGKGTFTWPDNTSITGIFINGEPEGKATVVLPNKVSLEGSYRKGIIFQGKGIYIYDDGSKYLGEWKDGKRHGKGSLFDNRGNIIQIGEWESDKFVKEYSIPGLPK